jgi:hypothetical protein
MGLQRQEMQAIHRLAGGVNTRQGLIGLSQIVPAK